MPPSPPTQMSSTPLALSFQLSLRLVALSMLRCNMTVFVFYFSQPSGSSVATRVNIAPPLSRCFCLRYLSRMAFDTMTPQNVKCHWNLQTHAFCNALHEQKTPQKGHWSESSLSRGRFEYITFDAGSLRGHTLHYIRCPLLYVTTKRLRLLSSVVAVVLFEAFATAELRLLMTVYFKSFTAG